MCHNHSHLIATFLGEDTSYNLPVLTYRMESSDLRVEGPRKDDGLIVVRTTGLLRLPSLMLAGFSPTLQPRMGAGGMSLFCLPEGATTIILEAAWDWLNASAKSLEALDATELRLRAIPKSDDDEAAGRW